MTFKVGDQIVISNPEDAFSGRYGVITAFDRTRELSYEVKFSDPQLVRFQKSDLKKVPQGYSDWPDDTEKQEPEPSYYDFPQGIEVRHISAHLTSFGGQALQYVARATRLDGRNKGNPIEDLTKALDFIQWEIDRLREIENG